MPKSICFFIVFLVVSVLWAGEEHRVISQSSASEGDTLSTITKSSPAQSATSAVSSDPDLFISTKSSKRRKTLAGTADSNVPAISGNTDISATEDTKPLWNMIPLTSFYKKFLPEEKFDQENSAAARNELSNSSFSSSIIRSTPEQTVSTETSAGNLQSDPISHYRLKPGDQIEISVWGEEMTRAIKVRPDGFISYLLIGEVKAIGLTFSELKLTLETLLDKYIIAPQVSIIGLDFKGNFMSILGAVDRPGQVIVYTGDRILDVLSKAGGLRYENYQGQGGEVANLRNAYLSRGGDLIPTNFIGLLYDGNMSFNHRIEIGDFIYIPSSVGLAIYVTGEVYSPLSVPYRGRPTLLDAITQAGGFNTKAKKSSIFLVRGGLYSPDVTRLNYNEIVAGKEKNILLEPGDIVHVPPTFITQVERLSTQIIPFLDTILKTKDSKDAVRNW